MKFAMQRQQQQHTKNAIKYRTVDCKYIFDASVSQNFILEYEKRMQTIHDKSDKLKHRFAQLLVSRTQ